MGIFLAGAVCGCAVTLLYNNLWRWLSIRVLPARYLKEHKVRRRKKGSITKEAAGEK